jgi:hypothetical protein
MTKPESMTDEEFRQRGEKMVRSRALLDEWQDLREMGSDAERYC